jgi:hypothetical protein
MVSNLRRARAEGRGFFFLLFFPLGLYKCVFFWVYQKFAFALLLRFGLVSSFILCVRDVFLRLRMSVLRLLVIQCLRTSLDICNSDVRRDYASSRRQPVSLRCMRLVVPAYRLLEIYVVPQQQS